MMGERTGVGEREGFAVSFVKIRRGGQLGYVIFPREDLPVWYRMWE